MPNVMVALPHRSLGSTPKVLLTLTTYLTVVQ